jgi:PKD repeat protein
MFALAVSAGAAPAWAGSSGPVHYAKVRKVCPAPAPGHATCFALVREPVSPPAPGAPVHAGVQPYVTGSGAALTGPAGGLTPEDLATAYGFDPEASGAGQTVGIVDAFDDPAIEGDLEEFDEHYGLPECTKANGCFTKVGQTGSTSVLPPNDEAGWSVEIALDVETVHAACPKCDILLVEANDSSIANLAIAVNEAVSLGATEVSNSYGGPEAGAGATERAAYNHPGTPIVASTGDDGYFGWDWINEGFFGDEMPSTPAALPSVVAVGGTRLTLNPDGTRANETVWNNNGLGDKAGFANERREGATGGGCSQLFTGQPWQVAVTGFGSTGCGTKRLDADISAVADPLTGLDIYDTYDCGEACAGLDEGWETIGGTSLSAPFISSLYALAGGGEGVAYPSLTLYGHAGDASLRFDVASGGNGFCGGESLAKCTSEWGGKKPNSLGAGLIDCEGTTACNAASGFDGPSGIGAPKGLGLFKPLLPTAAITAPGSLTAGSAAGFGTAASTDPYPGGSISAASWSWGDGTSGTGVSTTHTYAAPGKYTVTLSVTDSYGLTSSSVEAPVTVDPAPVMFSLSVAKAGTGNGDVVSTPAGIECGATCSAKFAEGTEVTLTATPQAGSSFSGWAGSCAGTAKCKLTLDEAREVKAEFAATQKFALEISKTGTGKGTVTSTPAGISCAAVCSAEFAEGQKVILTANPEPGSTFVRWSGDACEGATANTCELTMAATGLSVKAEFAVSSSGGGTEGASAGGAGTSTVTTPVLIAAIAPAPNSVFTDVATANVRTGALALTISVLNPGKLTWLASFPNGRFGAFASSSKCKKTQIRLARRCLPARIAFAGGSRVVGAAGTFTVILKPSASALKALENALKHKKSVPVSIVLTFHSSLGGAPVAHSLTVSVKPKK